MLLSKSRSMAVIWAVYRRLLRLPAGKTSRPVQRPRCPCVAPSRRFSRISEILGAHSPPDPSAERASAPSEPKRGRKSSRWNAAISDRLDSDLRPRRISAPCPLSWARSGLREAGRYDLLPCFPGNDLPFLALILGAAPWRCPLALPLGPAPWRCPLALPFA